MKKTSEQVEKEELERAELLYKAAGLSAALGGGPIFSTTKAGRTKKKVRDQKLKTREPQQARQGDAQPQQFSAPVKGKVSPPLAKAATAEPATPPPAPLSALPAEERQNVHSSGSRADLARAEAVVQ